MHIIEREKRYINGINICAFRTFHTTLIIHELLLNYTPADFYKLCNLRSICRIWYMGLCWILRGLKRQQQLTDRRSRWLKEKYLQLYFEESGSNPITAEAIRVFGGRDWPSLTESIGTLSPTSSSTLRRRNVKGKKTKSSASIYAITKVRTDTCFATACI